MYRPWTNSSRGHGSPPRTITETAVRPNDQHMSVAESLGAFFGAIWGGVRSTPGETRVRTVATRVEERAVDGITLRRTTIDEVIGSPASDAPHDPGHRNDHATH